MSISGQGDLMKTIASLGNPMPGCGTHEPHEGAVPSLIDVVRRRRRRVCQPGVVATPGLPTRKEQNRIAVPSKRADRAEHRRNGTQPRRGWDNYGSRFPGVGTTRGLADTARFGAGKVVLLK